jgi:hypothetical protein
MIIMQLFKKNSDKNVLIRLIVQICYNIGNVLIKIQSNILTNKI